jgi:hypothetical protein
LAPSSYLNLSYPSIKEEVSGSSAKMEIQKDWRLKHTVNIKHSAFNYIFFYSCRRLTHRGFEAESPVGLSSGSRKEDERIDITQRRQSNFPENETQKFHEQVKTTLAKTRKRKKLASK